MGGTNKQTSSVMNRTRSDRKSLVSSSSSSSSLLSSSSSSSTLLSSSTSSSALSTIGRNDISGVVLPLSFQSSLSRTKSERSIDYIDSSMQWQWQIMSMSSLCMSLSALMPTPTRCNMAYVVTTTLCKKKKKKKKEREWKIGKRKEGSSWKIGKRKEGSGLKTGKQKEGSGWKIGKRKEGSSWKIGQWKEGSGWKIGKKRSGSGWKMGKRKEVSGWKIGKRKEGSGWKIRKRKSGRGWKIGKREKVDGGGKLRERMSTSPTTVVKEEVVTSPRIQWKLEQKGPQQDEVDEAQPCGPQVRQEPEQRSDEYPMIVRIPTDITETTSTTDSTITTYRRKRDYPHHHTRRQHEMQMSHRAISTQEHGADFYELIKLNRTSSAGNILLGKVLRERTRIQRKRDMLDNNKEAYITLHGRSSQQSSTGLAAV